MKSLFTQMLLVLSLLSQQLAMAGTWVSFDHDQQTRSQTAHFQHVVLHLDNQPHHHVVERFVHSDDPSTLQLDSSKDSISHMNEQANGGCCFIASNDVVGAERYKSIRFDFVVVTHHSPPLDHPLRPPLLLT